ncbi:glycoside hydrolase family 55 protein [Chryseobacterium oranimense]|uniref:glycoside hydrolase family 55 protein n=1 Tax=Chryseobacterium oranimense TaxID=421058 RepID=UPI0021AF9601|nr:glycoside hydrolase family 55 protein [Chryseobacterium oranimense]UWX61530.1 glycoside hydrolase family 55 protein [Chryseobacterium oranimense]
MIFTNEFFSPTSTIADQNLIELIDEFTFEPHIYIQYAPTSSPPFVDGIIRRERNNIHYVNKTVSDNSKPIDIGVFGAKGDGSTDDTESINKAVLYLSKIGGGALSFNGNKKYLVSGPIFITNKVNFYCNGATFIGNGENTIVKTAYLENSVLVSNHQTSSETHIITFAQIKDANFENCAIGLDFFNFCHGSSLENIKFTNCKVSWKFLNCFYTTVKNVMSSGQNNNEYVYQFLGQNNALLLERVSATKDFGFLFQGGTTATTLISPTVEGGQTGLKFKDDCLGIIIKGIYAEGIFNAIDLSDVQYGNFEITGGYFNYVDKPLIGVKAPVQNAPTAGEITGEWRNNTIVNIGGSLPVKDEYGSIIGYNTYDGLMDVSQPRNYIHYILPTFEGNGNLPPNWIVGDFSLVTTYGQVKATDTKAIGNVKRQFGVIPVTRSGDVGDGKEGFIPDCTHELIGNDPSDFGIKIRTKIKFQEYMMFAKYNIYVATYSLGRWFYGDIFGKNLSAKDVGNSQVTSIENENGFLVIKITGFNEPNLGYILQGNVQLIV